MEKVFVGSKAVVLGDLFRFYLGISCAAYNLSHQIVRYISSYSVRYELCGLCIINNSMSRVITSPSSFRFKQIL